jgi:hypothetical protein
MVDAASGFAANHRPWTKNVALIPDSWSAARIAMTASGLSWLC